MYFHTCQPPEYKNLEMSRNLCIVRKSFRQCPNALRKSSEGLPNVSEVSRLECHATVALLVTMYIITSCILEFPDELVLAELVLVNKLSIWPLACLPPIENSSNKGTKSFLTSRKQLN